jgi:hypothetical protein
MATKVASSNVYTDIGRSFKVAILPIPYCRGNTWRREDIRQ